MDAFLRVARVRNVAWGFTVSLAIYGSSFLAEGPRDFRVGCIEGLGSTFHCANGLG
jgi:hypothetical protein